MFRRHSGNVTVKCCPRRFLIGAHEEISDAQRNRQKQSKRNAHSIRAVEVAQKQIKTDPHGKRTKQFPTDKAEIQAEQPPLVSIHNTAGFRDSFIGSQKRMLCHDIRGHRITVCFHKTRNDEKQCPEQSVHAYQQVHTKTVFQTIFLREQVRNSRILAVYQIQVEAGVAQTNKSAYNEGDDCQDDDANHKECQQFSAIRL